MGFAMGLGFWGVLWSLGVGFSLMSFGLILWLLCWQGFVFRFDFLISLFGWLGALIEVLVSLY